MKNKDSKRAKIKNQKIKDCREECILYGLRGAEFVVTGADLFLRGERVEKDLISGDSAQASKSEQGLIVFIGCGHAGVENILERAKEVCGDERIHAVIGGQHLKFSGPQRAVALGTYLQEEAVEKLFACHCTGKRKAVLPRQRQIGAGFEYRFPA